jgi:transposase
MRPREKRAPLPCSPVYASSLYPCDLTDAEWALRLLVNALFSLLRTGCAWRYLPRKDPP